MTGHSDGWIQTHESALIENPNATPNKTSWTLIHEAAHEGNTEIVRILAPLSKNPNTPDKDGWTPIHWAAHHGYTEIVKILAPLTNNPNGPNNSGWTPLAVANNEEIRRILESFNNTRKHEAGPLSNPSQKRSKKF